MVYFCYIPEKSMNGFNDYDRYGVEDAGSEKQKKITKIVLFIAAFALISMVVGSILLGD